MASVKKTLSSFSSALVWMSRRLKGISRFVEGLSKVSRQRSSFTWPGVDPSGREGWLAEAGYDRETLKVNQTVPKVVLIG